ncbi:MAG: hypothetical protein NTY98_26715 [Verrucomicrobia bacterium]|nr:hypothetical protein [Verrucomicrobiota bacterium]
MTPPEEMYLKVLHEAEPVACGLYLDICDQGFVNPDEAAVHFGLKQLGPHWREVDRAIAAALLSRILCEDMAFQQPRISEPESKICISEFLEHFGKAARFFTNGMWEVGWRKSKHSSTCFGAESVPATDATFDGGLLVLDEGKSGVLWLEDED